VKRCGVSTKISILHDRYSNEYQVFSAASFKKWAKFGLTDRHPQLEIQILRSARLQPAETFRHRREA